MTEIKNTPKVNSTVIPRRRFLSISAMTGGGLMIVPREVLGRGFAAPSDRLNIAGVGAGGRGHGVLRGASGWDEKGQTLDNIVALCDVDDQRAHPVYEQFPKARRYRDYRRMFDEMDSEIDAVTVATPDHMHAPIALAAMERGKHVYVEKPLTHNVHEARMLTEAARRHNLVTQMGNQGNSGEDIRRICEWIWAGTIGEVHTVHTWTNRPVWPQGLVRPQEEPRVPAHLDWNLWLGTAPYRPYHPTYHPFSWRGWWDFGTGALGDMACHIIDPVFKALKLGYPVAVEASTSIAVQDWRPLSNEESAPNSSMIYFDFPARGDLPPVTVTWRDGGLLPRRPEELGEGEMMGDSDGGCIFLGSKGKVMCGTYAQKPTLLPTSLMRDWEEPAPTLPRVKDGVEGHQRSWVEACKKGDPGLPSSNFEYAGPLTEMVLMGNLAIRSFRLQERIEDPDSGSSRVHYPGRRRLLWDGQAMRITNYDPANQFVRREYRTGW